MEVASDGNDAVIRVASFYRGSTARVEQTPGVGLGLAISQAIVGSYGGRIDASNAPQSGAVFAIRLPLRA